MKTKPIAVETQKFIVVHEFLAGRIAAESQASDRKLHYCYVLLLLHAARRRQLAGRKLPTTAEPKRWVMESRYSFLRVVGLQLNQSITAKPGRFSIFLRFLGDDPDAPAQDATDSGWFGTARVFTSAYSCSRGDYCNALLASSDFLSEMNMKTLMSTARGLGIKQGWKMIWKT